MSVYALVDLESISEVTAGNPAPQDPSHFSIEGQPFVRMQDVGRSHINPALMETTDLVSSKAIHECGLRLYPKGTLLIPKSGASVNLNHRAMLGQSAYVVSHLATIVPDQSRVIPSYLFHWSQHYDPRAQAQVTSLPSLPLSLIKAAKVPLPPLEEQQRLVGLLDQAADIQRRAKAAVSKARTIIPALFMDMFGDPETNAMDWPTKPLGETTTLFGGATLPEGKPFRGQSAGLLLCKVSTLSLAGNESGVLQALEWSDNQAARSAVAPAGSILFPKRGAAITTNKKRVLLRPGALDPNLMGMAGKKEFYNPGFLLALMEAFDLTTITSGSTVPQLNKQDIYPLERMIPPLSLQQEFVDQAQRITDTIISLKSMIAKVEQFALSLSSSIFAASE